MFKPNNKLSISEQHDQILNHDNMTSTIQTLNAQGMKRSQLSTAITRRLNEMGYGVSQAKVARRVKQVLG